MTGLTPPEIGEPDAVSNAVPYAPRPKNAATLKLIMPPYPHWTFSPIERSMYIADSPMRYAGTRCKEAGQNRDEQERGERAEQSYDTLLARRVRTDIESAHVASPAMPRGRTSRNATMMTNATAGA